MTNPFIAQTWWSLLANTFAVYRAAFVPLLAVAVVPNAIVGAITTELDFLGGLTLLLAYAANVVVFLLAMTGSITLTRAAVAGRVPDVGAAFMRAIDATQFQFLLALVLSTIIMAIGFVLVIVPGVIAALWLMLVGPVAVIERPGVVESLKRSRALVEGYNWRHLGYGLLNGLTIGTAWSVIVGGTAVVSLFGLFFIDQSIAMALTIIVAVLGALLAPLAGIWLTLVYIEMRARKEGYSYEALNADLDREAAQ